MDETVVAQEGHADVDRRAVAARRVHGEQCPCRGVANHKGGSARCRSDAVEIREAEVVRRQRLHRRRSRERIAGAPGTHGRRSAGKTPTT